MIRTNTLRKIRLSNGLTLMGLAAAADLAVSTITAIEKYNHYPEELTRKKLAAALGMEERYIWP